MLTISRKKFIQDYWDALNGKEKTPALIDKFVKDPGLKEHIAFFEAAFPKYEMLADEFIAEGDKVVVRARAKGVHRGDLMGIPPTGKHVDLPFVAIYEVAGDKIIKSWIFTDQMELMKQLGVMSGSN